MQRAGAAPSSEASLQPTRESCWGPLPESVVVIRAHKVIRDLGIGHESSLLQTAQVGGPAADSVNSRQGGQAGQTNYILPCLA